MNALGSRSGSCLSAMGSSDELSMDRRLNPAFVVVGGGGTTGLPMRCPLADGGTGVVLGLPNEPFSSDEAAAGEPVGGRRSDAIEEVFIGGSAGGLRSAAS